MSNNTAAVNNLIGYFRVHLSLHFKARLSAKSLLWKSVFIHIEIGINYHNKSFALRLALKERLRGTRKWPILFTQFLKSIGHFRITFGLFFKASLGAHLFIWKLVFICMWMKADFHVKRWAPRLALKKRRKVIRKWPICFAELLCCGIKVWFRSIQRPQYNSDFLCAFDWPFSLWLACFEKFQLCFCCFEVVSL